MNIQKHLEQMQDVAQAAKTMQRLLDITFETAQRASLLCLPKLSRVLDKRVLYRTKAVYRLRKRLGLMAAELAIYLASFRKPRKRGE